MEEIQGKRPARDYLADELKRLNRLNDILEKRISSNTFVSTKEPELMNCIMNNARAMCEIADAFTRI